MMVQFTEQREVQVLLEIADRDMVCMGPDDVDAVDQQLIMFVDAFRLACARRWACDTTAIRVTVGREHDFYASWQGWRVVARYTRGAVEELSVVGALPDQPQRARLQAAQKKRAC